MPASSGRAFARPFVAGLLVASLLILAGIPLGAQLTGRRAPSFALPDEKLVQHDILDYRGKWLLIDFMRTDCPHCQSLTRILKEIQPRYAGKLAELAIVVSPPDDQKTVTKYIRDFVVTFPILFDQGQVAVGYFKATPQRPGYDTPHLFVIDPQGQIVKDFEDGSDTLKDAAGLAKALDALINAPAKAAK